MAKKLPIWDQRLLDFIKHCVENNIQQVKDENDFIKRIGINNYSKLTQVRMGAQSFTWLQLHKTAKVFGVSLDYFAGFTDTMYQNTKQTNPLELLQFATKAVMKQYSVKTKK